MTQHRMQASIAGFAGKPATVYSLYDDDSGVLVVAKIAPFRAERFETCVLVSTENLPARDRFFDITEDLNTSILTFFNWQSMGLIRFAEIAQRCNPTSLIEADGFSPHGGPRYRISPDAASEQVAVLATCLACSTLERAEAANAFFEEILGLEDQLAGFGCITI